MDRLLSGNERTVNRLGAEYLVYFYLAVCIAMIAFNIWTIVFSGYRDRLNETRGRRFRLRIREQLADMRRGEGVSDAHLAMLRRDLCHAEQLLVYVQVLLDCAGESPDETRRYAQRVFGIVTALAPHYEWRSDPICCAFYLYVLRAFGELTGDAPREADEIELRALRMPNTYCRENALRAIYASGRTELVVQALRQLDEERIAHNRKLLSDGLITFTGDRGALISELWSRFEGFSGTMQIVILDFIRFCSSDYRDEMLAILTDANRDAELRYCAIRYFGRYSDERARSVLLDMARDMENPRWEMQAIACTALSAYPGEETVETLKRALHSANWYVRFNASESLFRLGVRYADLIEVIDGGDRYASEMLQFQLDLRYNERKAATTG